MASKHDFTEREQKLMAYAWQCFDEQPKVNFEKLATLAGFTNHRSASNAWGNIRKKLAAQAGDVAATTNGNEGTPKSTAAKKRGKKAAEVDGEGESPTKKVKKTPKKVKKEVVDEDPDAEGEVEGDAGEDDGIF